MPDPQFLSLEQVLLTTLVVKLAVMAALATMLVRYRRFRHILIFERRDWPDRLTFVLFFGVPLAAGVSRAAPPELQGRRPQPRRRVPDRPHRRPLRRRGGRGARGRAAARQRRMDRPALRDRLRLRRRRPARAVPEGGHLALLAVRLHEPAAPRLADDPHAAGGLAGRAADGAHRPRAAAAGARRAVERPSSPVLPVAERRRWA